MSDAIAYGLREDYAGTVTQYETEADEQAGNGTEVDKFTGGVVSIGPDGDVLDVKEELEKGAGVIVVDPATADPRLIDRLDNFPALKRVKVPAGTQPLTGGYGDATVTKLRDELKRRGIAAAGSLSHEEAVTALERFDSFDPAPPDGTHVDRLGDTEVPGGFGNNNGEEA